MNILMERFERGSLFLHQCNLGKAFRMIGGLTCILIVLSAEIAACPLDLPTTKVFINGYPLTAELATTPTSRSCGLSQRKKIPNDHGMLFIFPDRRPRTFWMKNTFIPLTIAFLDESGQILSIQDMVPLQTDQRYHFEQPAKYALEVNQGWFGRHGIQVGDPVAMKLPLVLDIR